MKRLILSAQTAYNLTFAVNEMDVGYQYREFLSRKIQGLTFTSPFKCDGFGVHKYLKIRILCEFKKGKDLKNRTFFAETLAQAIFYIKKFELGGIKLPTTILLGNRNECCVLHTNEIIDYLAMEYDWDVAPSDNKNKGNLIELIEGDEKINPFIFPVEQLDDVINIIKNLTDNVTRLIPITNRNIGEVFNYFLKNILGKSNLSTNQLANLFVQILVNPVENYLHPVNKVSAIVTKNFNQTPIKNRKSYQSFFKHFKSDYSPREKELLTSIVDRLIDDVIRRKQGGFFTPTIIANKLHEYISNLYGNNWKDEFVVWDPAWGTGNLTRDYKFKELYASTLIQSEIDTANQMGYNLESTKFQFDFLNDSTEFLPSGLKTAIKSGKKILILMNPPYMKSTPNKGNDSTGASNTFIGKEMNENNMGIASSQLSSQFIYRIIQLKKINPNIHIAMLNKPNFMTSDGFKNLRSLFLNNFGFQTGFIFNSSHFSDTSDSWGVSFTIWSDTPNDIKNNFEHVIYENEDSFELVENGIQILYNCDNRKKANYFFSKKEKNDIKLPPIKSFLTIDNKKKKNGSSNAVGYINNDSNNLMQQNVVFLASSVISANGNKSITPENFYKSISLFSARKIVLQNWINDKNEYLAPDEDHESYQQFCFDSVVYSLFNNSSQQSSLRNVNYDDQLWKISNQFFWLSKEEMLNMANEHNFTDLYNDARTDDERYVYKVLFGEERVYDKLSDDAKLVLDKATELVNKSILNREEFSNHENHLSSWDAGYAQLKLIWKEYYEDEFKEFRQLYKNLEDRMRPLVYELGFLLK